MSSASQIKTSTKFPLKILWGSITLLLACLIWACSVGRVYIQGLPLDVVEALSVGAGLVPAYEFPSLAAALAKTPFDPFLSVSLFDAVVLVGAFAVLWLSAYHVWQNWLSPTVASAGLFLGGASLWVQADAPVPVLAVAFKALGIACLIAGKVPLMLGPVMGAAYCDPAGGVVLFLALTYLAFKRRESYGIPMTACCILAAGVLLALLADSYTLTPSLRGLTLWSLLPVVALLGSRQLREARAGLYLTLILGSCLTGSADLSWAVCLGDLGLLLQSEPEEPETRSGLSKWVVHIGGLAVCGLAAWPGLSLYSQLRGDFEKHGTTSSIAPFSLSVHSRKLSSEPWRQQTPYPEMRPPDIERLADVQGPFRVLTTGRVYESRQLALLYALLAKQPLTGWESTKELSSSSLICKAQGENVLVSSESVLFRESDNSRLEPPAVLPDELEKLPEVSFARLYNLPFREQWVSEEKGTGFELISQDGEETLFFAKNRAQVVFSRHPHEYILRSLTKKKNRREFTVGPINLELIALGVAEDEAIPRFKLFNRGLSPISTKEYSAIVFDDGKPTESTQTLTDPFILYPEEGIDISLKTAKTVPSTAAFQTIDDASIPAKVIDATGE